ncbi:hypothetical protein DXG03_003520 [Asterophora parasitica]|uniref:Uncharacterized protein n=1 Tax=Asterophora parasitica TaxID=117018 RepID=A0A9P7KF42_9AGAR|nr:hypothetical protein DXG03_003520 [Asterophora parasitica]
MSSKDSVYSSSRSYVSSSSANPRSTRSDHTRQSAEHSRRQQEPSRRDGERSKRDTDYLQYYQSSIADGRPEESDQESTWSSQLTRQTSGGSTSPSDYSDSQATNTSTTAALPVSSSQTTRRSKAPSDGGSDRRRLAILEMDPVDHSPPAKSRDGHSQGESIRSRRGVHSNLTGLALVAPPDAAPKSYSHLTPPTTAPATDDSHPTPRDSTRDDKGHHRSASEATSGKAIHAPSHNAQTSGTDRVHATSREAPAGPRILVEGNPHGDQRSRHSRSPSPSAVSDASHQAHGLLSPVQQYARPGMTRGDTLIVTPEIGEEKEIGARVAAPVVISLESAGTHSTAGPIPPPPRAMFNIDMNSPAPPRPPRLNSPLASRTRGDIEAVKQALQLPASVTAALASRLPKSNPNNYTESPETSTSRLEGSATDGEASTSTNNPEVRPVRSVHRREGAYAPSSSTSTAAHSDSGMESQTASRSDITPPERLHDDAKALEAKSASSSNHAARHDDNDVPSIIVERSMQPINEQELEDERQRSDNTTRPKIISQHPPAMFCAEITTRKTSLERCALYAQKINELYMYDSGLGEWTLETKMRANNNRPTVAFSSHTFTPQPRHTSRASMISEATFPRRPDASTATDLSVKTQDLVPATPPVLPYPSLANQRMYRTRTSSSIASVTPPSSVRTLAPSTPMSTKTGFFASLGRKASMSSTRKPGLNGLTPPPTSPARLVKSPPTAPRVINISAAPSVPGGPRAAPNHHRAVRSQTIMTTTNPFASNAAAAITERNELSRRPSLHDITMSTPEPPVIDIAADPEFVRQVDKLVHLLPDADRAVLAGYLRRAGQDILAIGQYLEDEKNGTIKSP